MMIMNQQLYQYQNQHENQQHQYQQQQQQEQQHLICRCCLMENPTVAYNLYIDDNLCSELNECVHHVKYEQHDNLSDIICEQCCWRLHEANAFRRRCIETDQELRRRYDDATRDIEDALDIVSGILKEHECNNPFESDDNLCRNLSEVLDVSSELDSLDLALLNEFLLDDSTFSSIPTDSSATEDDAITTELLNNVFNDNTTFDLALNPITTFDYNQITNQSLQVPYIDSSLEYSGASNSSTSDFISYDNQEMPLILNEFNSQENAEQQNLENISSSIEIPVKAVKKPISKSLHPCTECEKKFTRNFQLKLHLISVHNIGDGLQYTCTECEKTFASRHSLSYHLKSIHSSERPFTCTYCSRKFVLRTQLASHLRIHTGQMKPRCHPCPECKKNFLTKSDLKTHYTRCHNPNVERPFKCHFCEKSFFTRSHLSSHLLVHTGEKPYECAFCGKCYQGVGNLNNHLVRRHGDGIQLRSQQVSTAATTAAARIVANTTTGIIKTAPTADAAATAATATILVSV